MYWFEKWNKINLFISLNRKSPTRSTELGKSPEYNIELHFTIGNEFGAKLEGSGVGKKHDAVGNSVRYAKQMGSSCAPPV